MKPPPHPGIRLLELLNPFDISQNSLARQMGVPPRRINEIVLGKRSMTPETAVLLEQALGTTAEMWMRLQSAYDIFKVRERLVRQPRAVLPRPRGDELPSLRIEPPPDPLDELLERYPIVRMGMKEAKAVRGESWRTRRRKARVKAERERIRSIHQESLDTAADQERLSEALRESRKSSPGGGSAPGVGSAPTPRNRG